MEQYAWMLKFGKIITTSNMQFDITHSQLRTEIKVLSYCYTYLPQLFLLSDSMRLSY